MLGPDQRTLLGTIQHGAHRAFQVRPLCRDGILDRAVAGQAIERRMKGNDALAARLACRRRDSAAGIDDGAPGNPLANRHLPRAPLRRS